MDASHLALTAQVNLRQTDYTIGKLSKLDPVQSHFVIRVHSLQINSGKSFWGASGVKMKNTAKYLIDHIHLYFMIYSIVSVIQILKYSVSKKYFYTNSFWNMPAARRYYGLQSKFNLFKLFWLTKTCLPFNSHCSYGFCTWLVEVRKQNSVNCYLQSTDI